MELPCSTRLKSGSYFAGVPKRMAAEKERELNAETPSDTLQPITWEKFRTKYFDTFYPGHELPAAERKAMQQQWGKSFNSLRSERLGGCRFSIR